MSESLSAQLTRKRKAYQALSDELSALPSGSAGSTKWLEIYHELQKHDFWCPADDPRQCRCWELARRRNLANVNLAQVDHAGFFVLKETCDRWAYATLDSGPWTYADVVPLHVAEGLWTLPISKAGLLEEDRLHDVPWPLPLVNSPFKLQVVLREWVEEPPDVKMRDLVMALPQTEGAIEEIRNYYKRYPGHLHYTAPLDEDELFEATTTLRTYGLPGNPTTAGFFLGLALAGKEYKAESGIIAEAPSRGVEVVSFGLVPDDDDVATKGIMIHHIEEVSAWRTDELCRVAGRAARKHQKWWESLPQTQAVAIDLRTANRPSPDYLSGLVEAYERHEIREEALLQLAFEHFGAEGPIEKARIKRAVNARIARLRTKIDRRALDYDKPPLREPRMRLW